MLYTVFADAVTVGPIEIINGLRDVSPVGLVALVVWWLTTRHEGMIKDISAAHLAAFKNLADKQDVYNSDYKALSQESLKATVSNSLKVDQLQKQVSDLSELLHDQNR